MLIPTKLVSCFILLQHPQNTFNQPLRAFDIQHAARREDTDIDFAFGMIAEFDVYTRLCGEEFSMGCLEGWEVRIWGNKGEHTIYASNITFSSFSFPE
jgi:hypothetical protein